MLNYKRFIAWLMALLGASVLAAAHCQAQEETQSQPQAQSQAEAQAQSRTGYAIEQFQAGNEAAAIRFLIQLAYQGNVAAQFNLGIINLDRDDKAAGEREAKFWFRRAAIAGDVGAQFNLGMLLLGSEPATGEVPAQSSADVPQDVERALNGLRWLERAAEGGKVEAQVNFGIYTAIDDRAQNGVARSWLQLAAEAGDPSAIEALDLLAQPTSATSLQSLLYPLDLSMRAEVETSLREVLADEASIYPLPQDDLNPIGKLSRGDRVELVAKENGWVQIRLLRGVPVWVQDRAIKRMEGQAVVRRLEAMLHLAPNTGPATGTIGVASKGESLRIIRDNQDWLLVEAPLRFSGWIRETTVDVRVSSAPRETTAVNAAGPAATVPQSTDSTPDDESQNMPEGDATGELRKVQADGVILAEPNGATAPLGMILGGDTIAVERQEGEYSFSERMPRSGWIFGGLVEVSRMPTAESNGAGAVNRTGARVRMEPSTQTAIIDQLGQGQGVQIIDESGGWYQIALKASPGWIASALLDDSQAVGSDSDAGESADTQPVSRDVQQVTVAADSIVYSNAAVTSPAIGRLLESISVVNPAGTTGRGLTMLGVPATSALYGWVYGDLVEVEWPVENGRGYGTVAADAVRIRADPTTGKDNVIGSLSRGTRVQLVGGDGDWLKVAMPPAAGFVVVVTE